MPPAEQVTGFFRYWTLKEAYIKAVGSGLAMSLQSFAFTLVPPRITFEAGSGDDCRLGVCRSTNDGPAHPFGRRRSRRRSRHATQAHSGTPLKRRAGSLCAIMRAYSAASATNLS